MVPSGRAPICVLLTLLLGFLVGHASAVPTREARAAVPLPVDPGRGVVAVACTGWRRSFGTGVLIAPDRVLTCRHVAEVRGMPGRLDPTSLEVWVDADGVASPRRFPVLSYAHMSDRVDLCVLEIGPDVVGGLPGADRVLAFSRSRVALGDDLYTIHHPRGRARQRDGGRALFPYATTAEELERVLARESGRGPRDAASEIRRSYESDGQGGFKNLSRRWAGQPVLGTDLRVEDGSSGAPVFDARTNRVVGIVFAGPEDGTTGETPSWERHEAVLPSAWILDDLARSPDSVCRAVSRGR